MPTKQRISLARRLVIHVNPETSLFFDPLLSAWKRIEPVRRCAPSLSTPHTRTVLFNLNEGRDSRSNCQTMLFEQKRGFIRFDGMIENVDW